MTYSRVFSTCGGRFSRYAGYTHFFGVHERRGYSKFVFTVAEYSQYQTELFGSEQCKYSQILSTPKKFKLQVLQGTNSRKLSMRLRTFGMILL